MSKQDHWERYKSLGARMVELSFELADAKEHGRLHELYRIKRQLRIARRERNAAMRNAMGVA